MLAKGKSTTAAVTTVRKPAQGLWMTKAPRPVKTWGPGEEPKLHELLADDTMMRLMARDRVDPEALLSLVRTMRDRLAVAG